MRRYAFLILPSHNRVYADAAPALARAELAVLSAALPDGAISEESVGETVIGGVPYVTFERDDMSERDAALLANLSSLYALFEVTGELLRPVELRRLDRFDDDLLTILKYPGKTNEQFTKLLLNVTLASSAFARELSSPAAADLGAAEPAAADLGAAEPAAADLGGRRLAVLDPLCGRGTTLNQALMYGFDAYGADIDARDVEAYAVFIQRWLKDKRLKHRADFSPVRRDRKVVARRLTAEFAATKDEYKAGDVQRLEVVEADTTRIGEFFRAASADLVVADLPYGVQHGSHGSHGSHGGHGTGRPGGDRAAPRGGDQAPRRGDQARRGGDRTAGGGDRTAGDGDRTAGDGGKSLARSPLDLLRAAAPAWARALRPGGALGISWNTHVARREDAASALADAGLEVLDSAAYRAFRHRVDQAITRDILVARKPQVEATGRPAAAS
jgi:tRNA G10  N-methylase Trm11